VGGTGWPARGIEEEDGGGVDDGDVNRAVVAFVGRMWEIRRRSLTADGKGIDFEAYSEFWSAEDTRAWIVAWTGNDSLAGGQFRFFDQDGTGGMAGIWLADPDADLLANPVVFFGSEGELAVESAVRSWSDRDA